MGTRLRARLVRICSRTRGTAFDHVWTGRCAGTFDVTPRIGCQDGIHYAGGYCFVGVPMGTMLGGKIARRILGRAGGDSGVRSPAAGRAVLSRQRVVRSVRDRWMSRHDR